MGWNHQLEKNEFWVSLPKIMSPKWVFFFRCRWENKPAEKKPEAFEDQDWEVLPQVFEA